MTEIYRGLREIAKLYKHGILDMNVDPVGFLRKVEEDIVTLRDRAEELEGKVSARGSEIADLRERSESRGVEISNLRCRIRKLKNGIEELIQKDYEQ